MPDHFLPVGDRVATPIRPATGGRAWADRLAEVTEALHAVLVPEQLLTVVVGTGLAGHDVPAAVVHLLGPDGDPAPAWFHGVGPEIRTRVTAGGPPPETSAVRRCVRTRRPVWRSGREEILGEWPWADEVRVLAVLPLFTRGRVVGTLSVGFADLDTVPEDLRLYLAAVAAACAHLVVRRPDRAGRPARRVRVDLALGATRTGAWEWDLRSGRILWSRGMHDVTGIGPEYFGGRIEDFLRYIVPEDLPVVNTAIARAVGSCGEHIAEFRVMRPDGAVRYVEGFGTTLPGPDGRAVSLIGLLRDATEDGGRLGPVSVARDRAQRRAAVLQEMTRRFSGAVTVSDVLAVVRDHVLPILGAHATILTLYERDRLRVAGHHGYPARTAQALDNTPYDAVVPVAHAARDRVPLFLESRAQYLRTYPGSRPHIEATPHAAWAFLPLSAAGRTVGTWVVGYDRPRRFDRADRELLTSLATNVAYALDRARTYDAEHELASGLQRVMLPVALPVVPGVTTAARYLPCTYGMQVGGDWYDVIELPGGRIGLVVGDVQGHDVHAAAIMGQLRIALRAYASEGHAPDEVVARTGAMLAHLDGERFATCVYAEVDPATRHARVVRAGHLAPLLVPETGRPRPLDVAGGLPLGVADGDRLPVTGFDLPPGSALALFTDGLVESVVADIDDGVERLATLLVPPGGGPEPLEETAERVARDCAARGTRTDDIAVLLMRLEPSPPAR